MTVGDSFPTGRTGRVIAHHGVRVKIETDTGDVIQFKPPRRSVWVVGDIVVFKEERPVAILPRTTELARRSPTGAPQPIAANIDRLLIVTACGESFKEALVDRFIVAARHAGVAPAVVVNKIDLAVADETAKAERAWGAFGVPVLPVSAATGAGVEAIRTLLADTVGALVGQSGVGKTSLINRLIPGLDRAVGAVNVKTEKGAHTTSSALLVKIPGSSGAIIDSPGVRQFAPSGLAPVDVARYFPGFETVSGKCRFRDCLHETEPACAIRQAWKEGALPDGLYDSYKRLLASVKEDARIDR